MNYLPIVDGSSPRWFSSSLSVCKFPREPGQTKSKYLLATGIKKKRKRKVYLWIIPKQQGLVLDNILVRDQKGLQK